jgi:hypothetical protein
MLPILRCAGSDKGQGHVNANRVWGLKRRGVVRLCPRSHWRILFPAQTYSRVSMSMVSVGSSGSAERRESGRGGSRSADAGLGEVRRRPSHSQRPRQVWRRGPSAAW